MWCNSFNDFHIRGVKNEKNLIQKQSKDYWENDVKGWSIDKSSLRYFNQAVLKRKPQAEPDCSLVSV